MGSVKEKRHTPDNDPDPSPQEWHRHYYYCDKCGSFDLNEIITPSNHEELKSRANLHNRISKRGIFVLVVGAILTLLNYYFIGLQILGLIIFLRSNSLTKRYKSMVKVTGVRCKNCTAEYSMDSAFITDTESNPMNFSMKNVPKPLYNNFTKDVW